MPAKKNIKPLNKKNIFAISLILILFSFYLFLAFTSYLFTWQYDNIKWIDIFSGSGVVVKNITGKLGAYFAYTLITRFIGLGAFVIPFILFIAGFRLLRIKLLPFRKTLKISIISALWLSLVLGYADLYLANKNFLLGGLYGYAVNKWLSALIGHIGTISLLTVLSFIIIINLHEKLWTRIHDYFYDRHHNNAHPENE